MLCFFFCFFVFTWLGLYGGHVMLSVMLIFETKTVYLLHLSSTHVDSISCYSYPAWLLLFYQFQNEMPASCTVAN